MVAFVLPQQIAVTRKYMFNCRWSIHSFQLWMSIQLHRWQLPITGHLWSNNMCSERYLFSCQSCNKLCLQSRSQRWSIHDGMQFGNKNGCNRRWSALHDIRRHVSRLSGHVSICAQRTVQSGRFGIVTRISCVRDESRSWDSYARGCTVA